MSMRETGPQRAQRRAADKGLTVGAPVRITHPGYGFNTPNAAENRARPMAKARPLVPLDFGQRMERYRRQACAVAETHVGPRWMPSDRQYRRARHKARQAAAPFGPKSRPAQIQGYRHEMPVIVDDLPGPARPASPLAPFPAVGVYEIQPSRGFRVVDRRGEHRA